MRNERIVNQFVAKCYEIFVGVLPHALRQPGEAVVQHAVPAFHDFRLAFDRPGQSDDLLDALRTLPSLGRLTDKAFPQAEKTLGDSTPVLSFIRPYAPDLVGFVRSFGAAAATYDANGHYARTVPVFDAFNFTDDANGGTLTLKDRSDRGKSQLRLSATPRSPSHCSTRIGHSAQRIRQAYGVRANSIQRWMPVTLGAARWTRARSFLYEPMILPYCTPEGQAVSHARHSRHKSRWRRTSSDSSARPSVTARHR